MIVATPATRRHWTTSSPIRATADATAAVLRELNPRVSPRFAAVAGKVAALRARGTERGAPALFASDEAQLLRELSELGPEFEPALFALDLIVIWKKKRKVIRYRDRAVALFRRSFDRGRRVFFVGAGTSYHAALCAGLQALYREQLLRHGCAELESLLPLLALDVELNAQGLGIWLDRERPSA